MDNFTRLVLAALETVPADEAADLMTELAGVVREALRKRRERV